MMNKVEELKELLNEIGWDIKGQYPNRWIFDHGGKKTNYRVKNDSIDVISVSEHTIVNFSFKGCELAIVDKTAVSIGTDHCFILFMNHDLNQNS